MLLLTTSIYKRQKKLGIFWIQNRPTYLFFSKEVLQMIGKKYNYKVIFLQSGFILMTYNNFQCNKIKLFFLKFFNKRKIFQLLRITKIFLKQKVIEKWL